MATMLNDKNMASDLLTDLADGQIYFANVINQCSNKQLRDTLISLRNASETFQFDYYQMMSQKGFATPLPTATKQEIQQIKSDLQG